MFKWFYDTWCLIMLRPIYFFVRLPKGEWIEEPVSFCSLVAWIVAGVAAAVIFITQYVPIGVTLYAGITGYKFILILPVLLLLAFMFYLITFVILGGVLMAGFLGLFYVLGWMEHQVIKMMGGTGKFEDMLKGSLYSSAPMIFAVLPLLMALVVKKELLTFAFFFGGFNVIYFLAALHIYGLVSIAAKQIERVSRQQALIGSLVVLLMLVVVGVGFDLAVLPKVEPFLK